MFYLIVFFFLSIISYLGQGLTDLHFSSNVAPGEILIVPLVTLSGVVLFPGESLPLRITEMMYVNYFNTLENHRGIDRSARVDEIKSLVAVICSFGREPLPEVTKRCHIGTIAEICSLLCRESEVRLLARGKYRYETLSIFGAGGIQWAQVRVLDDRLPRMRLNSDIKLASAPFPSWVVRAHDPAVLVTRARLLYEKKTALERHPGRRDTITAMWNEARGAAEWLMQATNWTLMDTNLNHNDDDNDEEESIDENGDSHSSNDSDAENDSNQYEYYTGNEDDSSCGVDGGSDVPADLEQAPHAELDQEGAEIIIATARVDAGTNHDMFEDRMIARPAQASKIDLDKPDAKSCGADSLYDCFIEGEQAGVGIQRMPSSYAGIVFESFHLAANMVLSDTLRQSLLDAPNAVTRLRMIISRLEAESKNDQQLLCGDCLLPITSRDKLCKVPGTEGEIGAYVNPHGIVHQTVTFREVKRYSVSLYGPPVIEDTWFPGYAWTIASCARCGNHLGWRFTAVASGHHQGEAQRPSAETIIEFWGIRRSALLEQPEKEKSEEDAMI